MRQTRDYIYFMLIITFDKEEKRKRNFNQSIINRVAPPYEGIDCLTDPLALHSFLVEEILRTGVAGHRDDIKYRSTEFRTLTIIEFA